MFDLASSLLAALVIALAAFGLGRPMARALRVGNDGLLSALVWGEGLGMASAGAVCWLLGLAGWFYPAVVLPATLLAAFWGIGELICAWLARRSSQIVDVYAPASYRALGAAPLPWQLRVTLLALATLVALASLTSALAPTSSSEALAHTLEFAKRLVQAHGFGSSDAAQGVPRLAELWYAWALTLDGPIAAGLVAWLCGLLVALATVLVARSLVGESWAPLAGAIVLLMPGVSYQMSVPLADLALAFFCALLLASVSRPAAEAQTARGRTLAALLALAAVAAQPVALAFLAAAVVARWAPQWWHSLRCWMTVTRLRLFGVSALASAASALVALAYLAARGPVTSAGDVQDVFSQLGPLLVALLPGVLLLGRDSGALVLVRVGCACAVLAAFCWPQVRFWPALVPLLALAVSMVWLELARSRAKPLAWVQAGLVALAAVSAAAPLMRAQEHWRVAIGWQTREDYLLAHQSNYKAVWVANHLLHDGDRLLSQDAGTFYFSCPAIDEATYVRRGADGLDPASEPSASRRLREAGFTHVLLAETDDPAPASGPAQALGRELDAGTSSSAVPILDYRWQEHAGTARRYRLVLLR